jgi:16S rRNA (cytidine1402-2'-O)-methyltransferase
MDSIDQAHPSLSDARVLHGSPALYVVATPLGNLADITLRALAILGKVDAIAAEDTRHSKRLLDYHGISTRLLAVHQHNENAAADGLVALLQQGQHIALITDAGTPAVSDPGARVVARVRAAGFPVAPIPGPSALIAALSVSGLVEGRFLFVGFLPAKRNARCAELGRLAGLDAALVFYEAPHRVAECVADLVQVLGGARELVVARELTKLHEQIAKMPLGEALEWFAQDANRMRGEFVLIVSPPVEKHGLTPEADRLLRQLLAEMPLSKAVKIVSETIELPKKMIYDYALNLNSNKL